MQDCPSQQKTVMFMRCMPCSVERHNGGHVRRRLKRIILRARFPVNLPATLRFLIVVCWIPVSVGCLRESEQELVVYSAHDSVFSEPILRQFESETGAVVRAIYDVESTKTVGLASRLIMERGRPRCDVFWNNEILHTLRLQKLGMLDAYVWPGADGWPEDYREKSGHWYGFAARARILIVNTELVASAERPQSVLDLVDSKWKGRVGMAKPLFGTTATHACVLQATWGRRRAETFFRQLKRNVSVMSGNKQVAMSVGLGELAFGLTDTDDAAVEIASGRPVAIVFPDQGSDEMGTLFIPNSLSILKSCPHPDAARKLVNYLLQPKIERQLARGASAQFPVNPGVSDRPRIAGRTKIRWMAADFQAAAEEWESVSQTLSDLFASAD